MDLRILLEKARVSSAARWKLNAGLRWMIPFNRPHGLRVTPLPTGGIRVDIPYKRANFNHIKGVHACCLATAAEFCTGLALMELLDAKRYRIIMKGLRMDYHYQAKAHAHAVFAPDPEEVQRHLIEPLRTEDAVLYTAVVELRDAHHHLSTGHITWQVKEWSKVRTKL